MKIAITGDALASRHLAPFDDPAWTIWGSGNGYAHLPRADAFFEIHTWANIQRDDDVAKLFDVPRALGVRRFVAPAEVCEQFAKIPRDRRLIDAEPFPFTKILAWAPRRYFTSTIAWQIAYALISEPALEELGLWGVDMEVGREYAYQKACAEF